MATHTVLNTPFLTGATASIYTRGAQVSPLDVAVPPGSTFVTSSTVAAGGSVTANGVTEGQKYWAVGQDNTAAWRWISFRVDETVNPSITASPNGKLRREKTEQLVSAAGSATVGYLTLKDQGCVLDGTTNDSAAFQNAVTTAMAQGKELAHLGGNLRLGTAIQGRYTMRLRGAGAELSIITQADTATNHHMLDWGGYSAAGRTSRTSPRTPGRARAP